MNSPIKGLQSPASTFTEVECYCRSQELSNRQKLVEGSTIKSFFQQFMPNVEILSLSKYLTGQSNPTYLVTTNKQKLVLRCKPPGELLPNAHLVEREFRVMSALASSRLPVPKMYALVDDAQSPIGRAFFIMEHVDGQVFFDPALPNLNRETRHYIYDQMNEILACLHSIEPREFGLESFGKSGNYFHRQTQIWSRQFLQNRQTPNLQILVVSIPYF